MATMTGSEFRDYVVRTFKRTDKDTELYEAVTDTVMDLRLMFKFDDFKVEAYATGIATAGDYKMDLPSDFGHLIGDVRVLDDDDSYTLRRLSKSAFDDKYPNPNYANVDTDKPLHYCIYGGQILVGPVPDDVTYEYEINYTEEAAAAITSGTLDVPFADRYREALKFGTLHRLYSDLGNDQQAVKYKVLYEEKAHQAMEREIGNAGTLPITEYQDI